MRILFLSLFLFLSSVTWAQVQSVKGRVVDASTQDGIAYTNIGVEGTFYGTASDAEGFFELKVPDEFKKEQLFFSAVGYENLVLSIPELLKKSFSSIQLKEQTYSIDDVNVAAQSRVLFRVIKSASNKISENFQKGPIGYQVYYSESKQIGNDPVQKREAIVEMTDETGYSSPSITDGFKNRNFQVTEVKRNFESYSIPSGKTGFEELSEMDLVRLANGILDDDLLNDYDLQLENVSQFNGDSVWIISYKTHKADLAHTGDYYATQLDGKLYISQNNYEILRNECVIKSSKNNPHNRSLASNRNEQTQVNYHLTATFKPFEGKYALSYLDCDKTYLDAQNRTVSYSRKASVLSLTKNPKRLAGKDYFENAEYVADFWNSFKRPQ